MLKLRLDEILEKKNISRYWLAQQIGVSYPTITRYYKNKTTSYEVSTINAICNILDCTPIDLFYYEKDEK